MEDEKIVKYIHDIVNKSVAAQSYIRLLGRTELDEKQKELLDNAGESLNEAIAIVKNLRKDVRSE